ncbi:MULTISPECIES: glycerol kinase GlpK [Caulobacter]|jgi:glycerol kinase|uniref:Glycerol kinase n=2 Tax=Pseudomonadota TaxID=1224 RepID=R0CZB9_CAUVI|nr:MULTISPECIES: glycerol kinase GlpK [Caulobacter]ENZ81796.1 glycerol kinase [Caulobacter vibrioides OR37]MBQ1563067.1 glycerol kinase GlpK [Caulobacter sp.]
MAQDLILALDQGTTSTRAILFDRAGQPLAEASRPLRQSYPRDGWVEHDAEEIHAACVAVLREATEASGRAADVAAIGVTNQRETVVIWDKATGRPIHPAIVWQDRRTAEVCARLKAEGHEPRVTEVTGLLLDPYFSGTKIAWILDKVPGARARAEAGELLAGTMDTWVIWKLTGGRVHATDATNASRTLLFDIVAQDWSPEMLDLFDVPASLLPKVLDCVDDYGATQTQILGRETPIRGVAGDQQAALMGQGCIAPGQMKATYGTGCFMLINTGEARCVSRARLLTTVAARVGGKTTYALEGSIFVAGAAIQWLGEGLGVTGGPRAAEALARAAKPDHAVVVVPAFTGLGAPWWDAEARGGIFGLTRDAGLPEIAAATFDSCALQSRDLIEAMRADAPSAFGDAAQLRIDGGMSQSAWFSQRLADLTGLPVRRARYQEITALGAALFAGVGAGLYGSLEEAAEVSPAADTLSPALDTHAREAAYARWLDAVPRVRL